MSKRKFRPISEDEVAKQRRGCYSTNTEYSTSTNISALADFYSQMPTTSQQPNFAELNKQEMNAVLEPFYLSCKSKCDEEYKASTWRTIRQSLRRGLKESHKFDIISDAEFSTSNQVFSNKLRQLKIDGKGSITHHNDISQGDLKLVLSTLSVNDAIQLQLLTWFLLQLHFCRRGVENLHDQRKDHYYVKLMNGKKCIVQNRDELTKNHRENDTERAAGAVVVEQLHEKCPVLIFEKYISKLDPSSEYLWQLPLQTKTGDTNWFHRRAGVNTIKQFMKVISAKCKLSQSYTNHCMHYMHLTGRILFRHRHTKCQWS
jgi:hypothetical protein